MVNDMSEIEKEAINNELLLAVETALYITSVMLFIYQLSRNFYKIFFKKRRCIHDITVGDVR